jgi:hypothetical protein
MLVKRLPKESNVQVARYLRRSYEDYHDHDGQFHILPPHQEDFPTLLRIDANSNITFVPRTWLFKGIDAVLDEKEA